MPVVIPGNAALSFPKDGGQEVVSGRGHAIVAARRGRAFAFRRAPLSADAFSARPGSNRAARDQVSGTFMPQKVRIALDAMGGDVGASVVIPGAATALTRHPDTEFLLFGDSALIEAQLAKYPALKKASRVIHTDVTVAMHDKPSQALRRGRKNSSMWLAIDAVKKGEADVAVSAGNTGALMAMARFHLHTMPGIDRPAIAGVWPTTRGDSVVLDLGASIGGDASSSGGAGGDGQRDGERAVRQAAPDRRPAQYRGRGSEGRRGNSRGLRTAARDEPAGTRLYRLRRGRRHRQGRRRRDRDRRLSAATSR